MAVRPLLACVVAALVALACVGGAGATDAPQLAFSTRTAVHGDTVEVRLRDSKRGSRSTIRLYLVPTHAGRAVRSRLDQRLHFVGTLEPRRIAGRAFTVPPLEPGTYSLAYWCRGCTSSAARVTESAARLQVEAPTTSDCPATVPNEFAPRGVPRSTWRYHGNGHLAVLLPSGSPQLTTNALGGYKMFWVARQGVFGTFSVSYRRVDQPSDQIDATTVRGSLGGYSGPSWASRMSFEPGCWRIDAHVFDVDLSFVAEVVRGER